jgi:phenylpropionate dioxygenase-like ring-hydroxylating dioxygenase large terminal subunit
MTVAYAELIEPTRVHGSLYTDPAIYAEELRRIWYRIWVYVGHASEVPNPGDRVAKFLGPTPVDLLRRPDGRVDLVDATGASLPRVDARCGFVFGSFAADGPDLHEHLGAAGDEIDRLARLSPEGEVELTAGWMKHRTQANWKLLAENETDGYHPQFVHSSVFTATDSPIGALYTERSLAACRDLGNGHSELDLRPEFRRLGIPMGWFGTPESKVADYVSTMRRLHGPAAEDILIEGAPHVIVFPNLFIAEVTVFVIQPLAVNLSVQHATAVQLKGAPDMNRRLLQQCIGSVGPAGLLLADDTELYERNQRGLGARTPEWLDLSRGLRRERIDERGLRVGHATDETAQRGFWSHYKCLMSG